MKNIFLLPTEEHSKLQLQLNGKLHLENGESVALKSCQHMYITCEEIIREDNWYFNKTGSTIEKLKHLLPSGGSFCKKIVLTTDPKLIADGVQDIHNDFLRWYINNPTCDSVKVTYVKTPDNIFIANDVPYGYYNIILPKTEQQIVDEDYDSGLSMGQIDAEGFQKTLSLAYESGRTLQVKYSGHWKDFVPQNQLDKPNFDHAGGIFNWRVKPIEEEVPSKSKYPIGGYAPGAYGCICVTCKTQFIGDKRAVQCEPCAIKEFKCTVCGGSDVQEKYWVNINTFAIVDPVEQEEDANKTWCNDCESHVEVEEVQLKSDSDLLDEIDSETEHLETTEGDSVECISIENLKGILKRHGIITN